MGAQQIIWGEVVGLFFADVVSARDMREFLLPSFDVIRIPQWAARAEYFAGDSHVEFIWIPVPTFDRIGKPGADFYPAPLPSPTPAAVAALFLDPQRPERNLSNSNYGVRANTLVSGWDLAAFYYRSFSTSPTFYRLPTGNPGQPFVFQPLYDRIWQAGGTVSKDLGDIRAARRGRLRERPGLRVTNPAVPHGVVKRSTLDYIVSVEFPAAGRHASQCPGIPARVLRRRRQAISSSRATDSARASSCRPSCRPRSSRRSCGSRTSRMRVACAPAAQLVRGEKHAVGFGVDIFTGPADGYFGRYNNRDRVYAELRYDF